MKRTAAGVLVGAAVVAVAAWGRWKRHTADRHADRWHTVTINRGPEAVGSLPEPLDELGEEIEVRVQPAPGGRGTEVHARLTHGAKGERVGRLRKALREAKQLAEVGEIVQPDAPGTTDRTLLSRPLEHAIAHGREAGQL